MNIQNKFKVCFARFLKPQLLSVLSYGWPRRKWIVSYYVQVTLLAKANFYSQILMLFQRTFLNGHRRFITLSTAYDRHSLQCDISLHRFGSIT